MLSKNEFHKFPLLHQSVNIFTLIIYFFIIYNFTIIKGITLLWIFYTIYYFIMRKLYKMERISPGDMTFMWNTPEKTFSVLITLCLDKMDAQAIKNLIIEKGIKKIQKLRCRLTYNFLEWWWKETSLEEAISRIEIHNSSNPSRINLKNKEEFEKWAHEQLETRFDYTSELLYKFFILENTDNDSEFKNLLVLKTDHALTDGVSLMNLICGIADNYDQKLFPATFSKSYNKIYEILSYLLFPFYLIKTIYFVFLDLRTVKTPFKSNNPINGKPKVILSDRVNLDEFMNVRKKLGITFNDLFVSAISSASRKYIKKHKDTQKVPDHIITVFPVNLKPIPKSVDDIVMTNNSAGIIMKIKLIEDPIKENYAIAKSLRELLRNFNYVKAGKIISDLLSDYMPFYISKKILMGTYSKVDLTVSNVPGPREAIYYAGCKVLDMVPMFKAGFIQTFIGINSYLGKFRIIYAMDCSIEEDPNLFISIFENELRMIKERVDNGELSLDRVKKDN